jgi:hypothetical protein
MHDPASALPRIPLIRSCVLPQDLVPQNLNASEPCSTDGGTFSQAALAQGIQGDACRVFERCALGPGPREHAQAVQVADQEAG